MGMEEGEEEEEKGSEEESLVGAPRQRSESWLLRTALIEHGYFYEPIGMISWAIILMSWFVIFLTFPLCLFFCVKIVKEYERAVIFRLGRLLQGGSRGPGLFFILPCIDSYRIVDLRVVSFDVPPQEILSKDSVTVSVDAVVYFHISKPIVSVTNVSDAFFSTRLLAQTTLRNTLGIKTLSEMLSERDSIANIILHILDEGTDPWGVKVDRVEVKDIRLPHSLMRSMATEAEASRMALARITAADGERKASRALTDAATILGQNKTAVHLRFLQTLQGISSEHNRTIVVPVPVDLIRKIAAKKRQRALFLESRKGGHNLIQLES